MRHTDLALDGVGAWGMTEPDQERAQRAATALATSHSPRTLREAYAAYLRREEPVTPLPLTTAAKR